jgi:hypothetical protein
LQTGTPNQIGLDTDFAGIGSGNAFQPFVVNGDPVLARGSRGFAGPDNPAASDQFWFRTTTDNGTPMFTPPAPGTFAPTGWRGSFYNPGLQSWNASLSKDFATFEGQRLQFRTEFFNFPNYANLNNPVTDPNVAAQFGKITGKNADRRQLQLSLRYSF